jgi:hypothetical protein
MPSIESQTKELLCYLWDNYLEGYASNSIVVMGVGDAYIGAKQLLLNRGKSLPPYPHPTYPEHFTLTSKHPQTPVAKSHASSRS